MLAPGEELTVSLGWAKGTGRVPVFYLSNDRVPKEIASQGDDGPRHERDGIVLTMNADHRQRIAGQLHGLEYVADETDNAITRRLSTFCAVNVSIDASTKPGIYRRYVHNISGTARMMTLSAEIVIIVQDDQADTADKQ